MPSRKKNQGRARKAKQAAAAHSNSTNAIAACRKEQARKQQLIAVALSNPINGVSCNHLGQSLNDWSPGDRFAVADLYEEFLIHIQNTDQYEDEKTLTMAANRIYDKYHQFNASTKDLFQRTLLQGGTQACLVASANDNTDLTKIHHIEGTFDFVEMIRLVEVRDKYNGDWDIHIALEMSFPMHDLVGCPRATVKFFHRRNHCDCLQEMYYMLKESSKRTSICRNCDKDVDIRRMSRCHVCKMVQYCSYECAVAHWPQHKEDCKMLREHGYPQKTKCW